MKTFHVCFRAIGGDVYECPAVYAKTQHAATIRFIHLIGYRRADVVVCAA